MLGRFVVPAARLVELGRAADAHFPEPGSGGPWRLSALVGGDAHGDAARIASFNDAHAGRAVVDAVELKAAGPAQADDALEVFPPGLTAFVEVPLDENLDGLLAALKRRGARAKIRTGGVLPEAIPEPGRRRALHRRLRRRRACHSRPPQACTTPCGPSRRSPTSPRASGR